MTTMHACMVMTKKMFPSLCCWLTCDNMKLTLTLSTKHEEHYNHKKDFLNTNKNDARFGILVIVELIINDQTRCFFLFCV